MTRVALTWSGFLATEDPGLGLTKLNVVVNRFVSVDGQAFLAYLFKALDVSAFSQILDPMLSLLLYGLKALFCFL